MPRWAQPQPIGVKGATEGPRYQAGRRLGPTFTAADTLMTYLRKLVESRSFLIMWAEPHRIQLP